MINCRHVWLDHNDDDNNNKGKKNQDTSIVSLLHYQERKRCSDCEAEGRPSCDVHLVGFVISTLSLIICSGGTQGNRLRSSVGMR